MYSKWPFLRHNSTPKTQQSNYVHDSQHGLDLGKVFFKLVGRKISMRNRTKGVVLVEVVSQVIFVVMGCK